MAAASPSAAAFASTRHEEPAMHVVIRITPETPWELNRRRCRSWRPRPRASASHLCARTGMPLWLARALCVFSIVPVRCKNPAWHATWMTYHEAGLPTGHYWLVRRRPKDN
ncbi:hypothetical protein [Streptomyces sp. NPDC088727]|uniref:hypothetical protein n=1 Tax=Streptomyces sp. NPDC088727 TaxID=3365875 RepID=UPI00382B4BED